MELMPQGEDGDELDPADKAQEDRIEVSELTTPILLFQFPTNCFYFPK
jgi:hypothetical protein